MAYSQRNVHKATASINNTVLCRSKCVQCRKDAYNEGIRTKDNVHRICKQCSKHSTDCQCYFCGQNIFRKKEEKNTRIRNCVSYEIDGMCEICKQYITCGMLIKFYICSHKLCLRCISDKLHREQESCQNDKMLKCICKEEYSIEGIMRSLAPKLEEQKYTVKTGESYCNWCQSFSQTRVIQLSCNHTICIGCMRRMEQSGPTRVLPLRGQFTKIVFCQGQYCQTWFSIDDSHRIIEEERQILRQIIEYILSTPKLKSTNKEDNCDCCDTWKKKAVIELGCNHKLCLTTLRRMIESADKRPVEKDGKTYHLIKCTLRQCERHECEEQLREWIINCASNIKPTKREDRCDCCTYNKVQANIELDCNHKLCKATIQNMLSSSDKILVQNDEDIFHIIKCKVLFCHGLVCEEKLKEWNVHEERESQRRMLEYILSSRLKSTNRKDKCDCCDTCKKQQAVIELGCNHKVCYATVRWMIESADKRPVEKDGKTYHLIKCRLRQCEGHECEEQLREWIINSSPSLRLTEREEKCNCCIWWKDQAVIEFGCQHKLCRATIQKMMNSSEKISVKKDGKMFHLVKCLVGSCEGLVCEEKLNEWIYDKELTQIGKFVSKTTRSLKCNKVHAEDTLAIGSIRCGHSFCMECFRDMLGKYVHEVLVFNDFKIGTCLSCDEPVPIESIENFLVEIEFSGVTSGTRDPKTSSNVMVSKSLQNAPSSPTKRHDETSDQWKSESRETKGILNIGLTCYGNCILQVLAQTPNFLETLEDAVTTMTKNKYVFNNLCEVLREINESTIGGEVVNYENTYYLWSNIVSMNPDLDPYKQNDSHSFTLSLFSLIDEHCSTEKGPISSFEGELLNEFEFSKCKHTETSGQIFRSLTVPVFASRSKQRECTIENGIEILMREETFENNLVPCKECDVFIQ